MPKTRLDTELVKRNLAPSREKAQALIMAGQVRVDGVPAKKSGQEVGEGAAIEVAANALPYVSRGGLKLEKAIKAFAIDLRGKVCADIGASTGGFTDCMLQFGAAHVTAIDVGYGQLDWSLRQDPRVTVRERANARFMEPSWFDRPLDFASIDVSFISLALILPPLLPCLTEGGEVVALIKPQFEAGRAEVGKHGVVRDPAIHAKVCARVMEMAYEAGYAILDLTYSPITGPKGNREFLLYLRANGTKNVATTPDFGVLAKNVTDFR
ncbi:MAG: TlyA family RNA methyltransferase [Clostridiales bacterium]|nr:TlyA family RNA methyltransferase [Clostridiales bacterium]